MTGIQRRLEQLLPRSLFGILQRTRRSFYSLAYRGDRVHCLSCGHRFRSFMPYGDPPRPEAQCPACACLERHRLLLLYLGSEPNLLSEGMTILHLAPENSLRRFLQAKHKLRYFTADIQMNDVAIRSDVTRLPFRDAAVDAILCNHVLEHVHDDNAALGELFRVLRPGGWALLLSPVDTSLETTFEDPSITTPSGRERAFGQWDHVRLYGRDYPTRLERAGFSVTVDDYARRLVPEQVMQYGLRGVEPVYICRK